MASDVDYNLRNLFIESLRPYQVKQECLTAGDWAVSEGVWVDEVSQLVYFQGYKDTPLEQHLYAVSLQRPGEVRRLTEPGYSHVVTMNQASAGEPHSLKFVVQLDLI